MRKRSKKAGLPPGSLVHIGEQKADKTNIAIIEYTENEYRKRDTDRLDECPVFTEGPGVTWIDVEGVHDPSILSKIGECYGFHPLVLEDVMNTDQRPKMEDYTEYLYIVLRAFHDPLNNGEFRSEQISLILGKNFVVSFQEGIEGDPFEPVRERLSSGKGRLRAQGADYLAYALIDSVVDNCFTVLEALGERIEDLEEQIVAEPAGDTLLLIHNLKREMITVRRSVWPLREVIAGLERIESPLLQPSIRMYLRDVYDHTIQIIETVENYRDMTSGMMDIYLSSLSNRMNSVMKVLTIIATIFMPMTFMAGVYGMNFKHMPELDWTYGYLMFWLIILVTAVLMTMYFKRKGWF